MRGALLAALVALSAWPAAALEIRSYDVRIVTTSSGPARVASTVTVSGRPAEPVVLPAGFSGVTGVALTSAPFGSAITAEPLNGQTVVRITPGPSSRAEETFGFSFEVAQGFLQQQPAAGEKSTLPRGARTFRHALVNSQPVPIPLYRVEVVFPADLRAHAIREALPKPGRKEPEPRVQLGTGEGTPGARLQVKGLDQGDSTSMQIELVPRSRSLGWLIAGIVLSILYLVQFRDLVARAK